MGVGVSTHMLPRRATKATNAKQEQRTHTHWAQSKYVFVQSAHMTEPHWVSVDAGTGSVELSTRSGRWGGCH